MDSAVHPETAPDSPFRYDPWTWREPTHGEHFRRCSFCGSIHPEDLAAEPAWTADWADRKYGWPHKFYVNVPNRNPDALFVIGSTRSEKWPAGPTSDSVEWIAWHDLTPEQLEIARRDGYGDGRYDPTFVYFSTRPTHFGKFYSIHLSDSSIAPDAKRAIEQRSGLAFEFADGRVAWRPTPAAEQEHPE